MNTVKIASGQTKMVAHRGVSGLERENTNLAFVAAGNRSYFGIETDIHCTSDGNFVLHHDDTTLRLTGVDCEVEKTDFATLRAMRLSDIDGTYGREDLVMPTLEEYIRICKKYEKMAVLELKRHMEEDRVREIIDRIEALDYLGSVIFISFDFDNLVYVRNYRPDQAVQFLFSKLTDEILEKMIAHRFDADVHFKAVTPAFVFAMHAAGLLINCWTVDNPSDAAALVELGVDFITSNILE
ncbi:MAG: hypothetical protein IKA05_02445 [Clostridia bacterium]|nr:hypothetical protein [Clostridia bacterium]